MRKLLVTAATGKQGGAVIDALVALPITPPVTIIGVTRNVSSARAQALAFKPNVSMI